MHSYFNGILELFWFGKCYNIFRSQVLVDGFSVLHFVLLKRSLFLNLVLPLPYCSLISLCHLLVTFSMNSFGLFLPRSSTILYNPFAPNEWFLSSVYLQHLNNRRLTNFNMMPYYYTISKADSN